MASMRMQKADVVSAIMAYIRRHRLSAGDRLPVRPELSAILHVGPRRLREALSVLEHQGIIETRNRGGTLVGASSVETLGRPLSWHLDRMGHGPEETDNLRALIEGAAAWQAARRRRPRDLLAMLDALQRLEQEPATWAEDAEAERDFHGAVLQAARNPLMATFTDLIATLVADSTTRPRSRRTWRKINAQHRPIYEAIERRDAVQAMELLYRHLMAKHVQANPRRRRVSSRR